MFKRIKQSSWHLYRDHKKPTNQSNPSIKEIFMLSLCIFLASSFSYKYVCNNKIPTPCCHKHIVLRQQSPINWSFKTSLIWYSLEKFRNF